MSPWHKTTFMSLRSGLVTHFPQTVQSSMTMFMMKEVLSLPSGLQLTIQLLNHQFQTRDQQWNGNDLVIVFFFIQDTDDNTSRKDVTNLFQMQHFYRMKTMKRWNVLLFSFHQLTSNGKNYRYTTLGHYAWNFLHGNSCPVPSIKQQPWFA